jgi:hypothetical protein
MPLRETYVIRAGRLVRKHLAGPKQAAPYVVRDLAPYRSVARDLATGQRAVIDGRAQHRAFLRRNNYVEVGNDYVAPRRDELTCADRIADIRRALRD